MADHFLDATKKADFIRRDEVHVQIERALCDGLPYHRTIDEIPAADVVEVVRCKDCKLMCHDEHGYWCINDYQACLDPEKDYCSRAARRADNG